jgi:FdhD protein
MEGRARAQTKLRVTTVSNGVRKSRRDVVATEEPLEIRIEAGGVSKQVAVTMRTPGHDFELAAGFLFAEGIIGGIDDVATLGYCVGPDKSTQEYNVVSVDLRSATLPDHAGFDRNFAVSSACGVCGKESLDQIERRGIRRITSPLQIAPKVLTGLPDTLRAAQRVFAGTGGLHAAGLFRADGTLLSLREDVGRHNAVDKLIGDQLLNDKLPLSDGIILVSGRTSFEIAQKVAAAGAPVLAAVSAPSSLAVEVADRFGLTLIGFLRGDTFNIYTGAHRIETSQ